MTGPVTTEALRTALVHACFDPGHVIGPRDGRTMDEWRGDACMKQLAPLLASLQQVTAERDAKADVLAEMKLCAEASAVEREGLLAELARLRAEGEAKDRALKAKAEEQVAYWRERQRVEKCLEDGVSEDGSTYTPIGDVAAWQGGYCNGRMSEADWWAKTLQYWPGEAAQRCAAPFTDRRSSAGGLSSDRRTRLSAQALFIGGR